MTTVMEPFKRATLSIPEVARILSRSELSVRRAIERGQLPARRWGSRVVILSDELEVFLHNLPCHGPSAA
jgi:excisionase family DNA binding protein